MISWFVSVRADNERRPKRKGREPDRTPSEAPRSARARNTPSRARWARAGGLVLALENSRFSEGTVAPKLRQSFCSVFVLHRLSAAFSKRHKLIRSRFAQRAFVSRFRST
jgi:hypothetical protein